MIRKLRAENYMNRVLLYAFLVSVLCIQAGCHRQRVKNSSHASTITADTVAMSQPQSATTTPTAPVVGSNATRSHYPYPPRY